MVESLSGKRVLVVDDELHLRLFIKAVFETAGNTVEVARDGKDGFAKAAASQPDLITLDLMMPGEGGIQMYRRLKEDATLQHVPVMIVSAVDDKAFSHAIKLINAGRGAPNIAQDSSAPDNKTVAEPEVYISKPPTPEKLLEGAARLLSSSGKEGDLLKTT